MLQVFLEENHLGYIIPPLKEEVEVFVSGPQSPLTLDNVNTEAMKIVAACSKKSYKILQLSHPFLEISLLNDGTVESKKKLANMKKHLEINEQTVGMFMLLFNDHL